MDTSGEYVVARIGRAHSLKGEVTVRLHTDEPAARFVAGATFPTRAHRGSAVPSTLTLRSARAHNGTWLLAFEQVTDRSAAEALRGTLLLVRPAAAMSADPAAGSAAPDADDEAEGSGPDRVDETGDEWYEEDLVGLTVVTTGGEQVGTVTGLQLGAAQDLLVLRLTGGGTAYVPFVSALVPEVDVAGGRVVIDPPEGLLELNA